MDPKQNKKQETNQVVKDDPEKQVSKDDAELILKE